MVRKRFPVLPTAWMLPRTIWMLVLLSGWALGQNEGALAIVDAGVQPSEDAPFVTTDYQFLPGETLWVSFHVSGYAVKVNEVKDSRSMDIEYSAEARDGRGVPLAEGAAGELKAQLGPEDKNWTPLKRASFVLPSLIAAGECHVHIGVRDVLGKAEASKDLTFRLGGLHFEHVDSISAQHFRFLRAEGDRESLELAAYQPGDTVFSDFDMTGFELGPGKTYRLGYGVTVLRPDGKPFLEQPDAARFSDSGFYPAAYVPAGLNVLTDASSPRGEYLILLTVRDLISGKSSVSRHSFALE